MQSLSATSLLYLWEQIFNKPSFQRALILLSAACPELPPEKLERLSLGERDYLLFRLREQIFGPNLVAKTDCPECDESLEMTLVTNEIYKSFASNPKIVKKSKANNNEKSFRVAGYSISCRLPDSLDLAAVSECENELESFRLLLQRCIIAIKKKNKETNVGELHDKAIRAIVDKIGKADPVADVLISLNCPSCEHRWKVVFDIVSFLLSEIDAWAQRTLYEVFILASKFGWNESDILSMSAWRRQYYMEMHSAG
jgi:uncharacterized protein (UPF0212 family)